MIPNEEEIVIRIKQGDRAAFCEWVDKYKEKALRIAYSFCADYEEAKDLSQEAFIKAFKTMDKFKGNSKFSTWFYSILVNVCKDYLRHKKRANFIHFNLRFKPKEAQTEVEDIFETVASKTPDPHQILLNKELKEKLTEAINELPEKQKAVFTLRNIHGLSIAEIAQITKCAQGTIKAHIFKATLNLRYSLVEYAGTGSLGGVK